MTIIAFRAKDVARKSPAATFGTALAVAAAVLVGLGAAAIGQTAHHDWQATLARYVTLPGAPAANPVHHAAPTTGQPGV